MRKKRTTPKRPGKTKPTPFGYQYHDGQYIIDETNSGLVYDIFTMFNNRQTLTDIAWTMESEEWPTVRGGKWTAQTIKGILSNRFYVDLDNPIVTDEVFNKATDRLERLKPGPQ